MKNLIKYLFLVLVLSTFILSGCKKDPLVEERVTDPEFQTLITYLADNNMDLSDILNGWKMDRTVLKDNLNDYYVIDIRSAGDYAKSHIPGAVHSTLAAIVNTATTNQMTDKPIVVTCYTGQSAGHGLVALRMSGLYTDAKVLIFGMSGWHTDLSASWDNNTADAAIGNANWVAAPGSISITNEYDDPDVTQTGTGQQILATRLESFLAATPDPFTANAVTISDVLGNPGNYFVNNYWATTDVEKYGNILGSFRINPLTIEGEEYSGLNPDKPVVTYCWTAQTSSVIAAYLDIIGYDAKTLKFGANGMIHSLLESSKWTSSIPIDGPLEGTDVK